MKIEADQITVRNGGPLIAEVTQAVAQGDHIIDFSTVRHVDSTALAVILAARRVLESDKTLELQHPPAQLSSLIAAFGVQSLFS